MRVLSTSLLAAATVTALCGCKSGMVDANCYWGPIPDKKDLVELKQKGVKTIVMVRMNPMKKVEANARTLGLNYVHIPTGLFTPPTETQIETLVSLARDPKSRPLYICDQAAKDRTQFYAAVYGMVSQGWSAERASKEMYNNGLRHWWPWFYKYKDVVKANESKIHGRTAFRADVPVTQ